MRKSTPVFLIVLSFAVAMIAWLSLPARVALDLSSLMPVEREMASPSSSLMIFVFPALALAVWIGFSFGRSAHGSRMQKVLFRRIAPEHVLEPAAFDRFRATYDVVVNLVIAFVVVFELLSIGLLMGGPAWLTRGFSLLVAIGLAALGNVMPRFRPNPIMGVRTPTTLNDPRNWARTHRVLGAGFVTAGIIMMILTFALPGYAFTAGVLGILLSCVVAYVYSTSLRAPSR